MKNILCLIISMLFVDSFYAQTQTENYIKTSIYTSESGTEKIESIQYMDALGRPKQSIAKAASPTSGKDLVTHYQYENGKALKSFMPYPVSNTNMQLQNISEANINSYYGVFNAFTEKVLDNSPLERITSIAFQGEDWKKEGAHTQKFSYAANSSNEVIKFITTANYNNSTLQSGISFQQQYYATGQLAKTTVVDEDGSVVIEFKNSYGQTVLNRKVLSSSLVHNKPGNPSLPEAYADTYYVYNIYGQLVYTIPPLAVDQIKLSNVLSDSILNELCYQYTYDNRNRQISKKLPGKDWEYMVYDLQNRLVASKHPMQSSAQWLFSKYDKFGRVLYTGNFGATTRDVVQAAVDAKGLNNEEAGQFNAVGTVVYYTRTNAYPSNIAQVLSINYYDTYPIGSEMSSQQGILTANPIAYNSNGIISNRNTKGLPTVSMVKNLSGGSWTKTYNTYDSRGRVIESYISNHLGGYTHSFISMDFIGKPLSTIAKHKRLSTDNEVIVKNRFVYKNQALEKQYHQVDSYPEELLAQYTYNDIGQLINKKVGGTDNAPYQSVDYTYNIRGWMTGINTDQSGNMQAGKFFNYKIKYNTPDNTSVGRARFNGNIAEVDWRHNGGELRRYSYVYDGINRLAEGIYQQPNATVPVSELYNEKAIYDSNGNILNLQRNTKHAKFNRAILMDDLEYSYTNPQGAITNKLQHINDISQNASGYPGGQDIIGYDTAGNMTSMPSKGITSMTYNFLNLVADINYGNTNKYEYRADGAKIRKTFTLNNTNEYIITDYLDGFQYTSALTAPLRQALESDDQIIAMAVKAAQPEAFVAEERELAAIENPGGSQDPLLELKFFPTAEGYYDFANKRYIYQYKDHLGNIRVSYSKNSAGVVTVYDKNDYYPFGMNIAYPDAGAIYDPLSLAYKYNGKELQETGMYDYGWRQYFPDIGRWNGMDQLAEAYTSISPYAYVANNPAMLTDPDGRWIDDEGNMSNRSGQTTFLHGASYQPLLTMGSHGVMTNPLYANYSNSVSGGDRGFGQVFLDWIQGLFRGNKKDAQFDIVLSGATVTRTKGVVDVGELVWEGIADSGPALRASLATIGRIGVWSLPLLLNGDAADVDKLNRDTMITLYRGVHGQHPDLANAYMGKAIPWGGNASAKEHNMGNNNSPYTSWTSSIDVANYSASRRGEGGIILKRSFPLWRLSFFNRHSGEYEVQVLGPVTGAQTIKPWKPGTWTPYLK